MYPSFSPPTPDCGVGWGGCAAGVSFSHPSIPALTPGVGLSLAVAFTIGKEASAPEQGCASVARISFVPMSRQEAPRTPRKETPPAAPGLGPGLELGLGTWAWSMGSGPGLAWAWGLDSGPGISFLLLKCHQNTIFNIKSHQNKIFGTQMPPE